MDWVVVFFGLKAINGSGWVSMEEFFDRHAPKRDLAEELAVLKAGVTAAPSGPQAPFTTFND